MLGDEQIDHVLAPLIDDRGNRLTVDIVEPAAEQRKALRGQVDDRGRDIHSAVEPRLDGMLVAGRPRFLGGQRPRRRRTGRLRPKDCARYAAVL